MTNFLDGKNSNTANWYFTVLLWMSIIGSLIFSKDFRNAIKNLDFNKDFCHYIIMFFYFIYLITQLVTTGFRKFMRIQGIKAVLRKNIEQNLRLYFMEKLITKNQIQTKMDILVTMILFLMKEKLHMNSNLVLIIQ